MYHIEIKTRKYVDKTLAQKIINKKTIVGILCTGKISGPAKKMFDDANIAWAENIPEEIFIQSSASEVESC